ncbi:MAG: type II toxin-antitoxin system VapC family toxin [Candidatus Woesearchaeota archaeon]|nr:type II toxin-antitoxin system VapC family toxin [Candidatus Woesearchaeota archaeon]MDP7457224.1 type II toxin-antitoxin system VapC family toxin [Candidatus Woesearchaeota archaeon]
MYLVDTDVCIDFMRGKEQVVRNLTRLPNIMISSITLAELFFGIYKSNNPTKHKKRLGNFLENVTMLDVTFPIAYNFGKIKSQLSKKGKLIGDFDIMNGSFALTYEMPIITNNVKHYNKIEGITIKSISTS